MRHNIAKKDHMASAILMARGKCPEGDKAYRMAMSSVCLAVTKELSHHRVDVVVAAAPKSFQCGGEHVALGGGSIEFGATLLHLADDHVGHVRWNTKQRVSRA
jgi:hypothetical protein